MKAWLNLRYTVADRAAAFRQGLERLGHTVVSGFTQTPDPDDVLVTWNRIGQVDAAAKNYRQVIVAENAAWGNDFLGGRWYSLARDYHNTAGRFPVGGPDRWDSLGVELAPWRSGTEVVILPQRGIGPPGVAMPHGWAERTRGRVGGRIRQHPGRNACVALQDDLARAGCVWTWGSGAAVKALLWGVPVHSEMPEWVGQQDNTDRGRLAMLRRLAWAQWRLEEIASGEAFERLLAA